ncbi:predicted protein [Nematostella vectensis]|uniref:Gamma-tubulin complex component 6 n=2 Tax=Nematostella vectensis TaxID=45351 RepID=A7SB79_NEMVE|nr:predicted protein [Nematostella vectensis]|eukprot:XP_001631101.1 predicted protein [Nematostella vectensis]
MAEGKQGFHALFSRLCEIAFSSEAAKREDNYTRIRFTRSRRAKLQQCLYERFFRELHAPWALEDNNGERLDKTRRDSSDFDAYDRLAVIAYNLRVERKFDQADALEYLSAKWRSLPGQQKGSFELVGESAVIAEPEAIIRFIVALEDSQPNIDTAVLGYQSQPWSSNKLYKEVKSILPEGPLLNTDSDKLRKEALLQPHYVHYSVDLFERVPTLGSSVEQQPCGLSTFEQIARPTQGRQRFFTLQEEAEEFHDEKTRKSLFSALTHARADDMQVRLGLPDLPMDPASKTFGLSSLEELQSPEDEGFHEGSEQSKDTSLPAMPEKRLDLAVWSAALQLEPQRFYTWEMGGRRDADCEKPYITEAGPAVFDELYNSLNRQVSFLVSTPTHYRLVSLRALVHACLNILIGVPSSAFLLDKDSVDFIVNDTVRLSGCSPDLLHDGLRKLASIGTDYFHVASFSRDEAQQSGGLVMQAFLGSIKSYLQCYRAVVLSIKESDVQSPLQLTFFFQSWGKQLRFLADMCMCSSSFRRKGGPTSRLPTGVKLLTYLYQMALEHASSPLYPVLLSLLKQSCAPYIMFVQDWVFKGVCKDTFGEFIIEVDDHFLAYRDKHYWSHGFVMSEDERLDCVPMFLSDLANDIFVCGKSINLLRLCTPEHFLCDASIPPPRMEVTFSMQKLKTCDERCRSYLMAVQKVAQGLKDERDSKRLAVEEKAEKVLLEEKEKAEKAFSEITGLIEQVRLAVEEKKREDLKMLKEEMEEAIKQRELEKELKAEEDKRYMEEAVKREALTTSAAEELKEKARQDLIKYYEELTVEMERREQRAQWQIRRHELDTERIKFFAEERAKLEALHYLHENAKDTVSLQTTEDTVSSSEQPDQSSLSASIATPKVEERSDISSVPSPSLVSLIASGLRTNALVQAEAKKSLMQERSEADSGVVSVSRREVDDKREFPIGQDSDALDTHTLVSVPSFDEDDTDVSEASSVNYEGRKKWTKPKDDASLSLKHEGREQMRKAWEAPAEGDIKLAESKFPHGHPAESSIQFTMYGDKPTSLQVETSKTTSVTEKQPKTAHPADSSLQHLLYPEPADTQSFHSPSAADVTLESVLIEVGTPTSEAHGHPLDSTVSNVMYPTPGAGNTPTATEATRNNATPPTDKDTILQDFLQSISSPVRREGRASHPADSTMTVVLYPSENLPISPYPARPRYGHPTDSSAQGYLYPSSEHSEGLPDEGYEAGTRHTKSGYGHPSDSQFQVTDVKTSPGHPRSAYGHPSDSQFQETDVKTSPGHPRSAYGHPSDSQFQETDVKTSPGHPRSAYGHPSDSQFQETGVKTSPGHPRSAFGHPSDSQFQESDSKLATKTKHSMSVHGHPSDSQWQLNQSSVSDQLRKPQSLFGHPSDSQLDRPDDTPTSPRQPRSKWGHPSSSTVQRVLGDISSLSDSSDIPPNVTNSTIGQSGFQTTRGVPPAEHAKALLYPGVCSAGQEGKPAVSTRGHEPAVRITQLMYPAPLVEEEKLEKAKPIVFEDIWMASQVEPLRDDFSALDDVPTTDLLRGALKLVQDKDEDESVDAAQLMSLPVLLQRSVTAPLIAQITLVNKAVVEYFIEELQVQRHFDVFRKFLFMEDGEFSLSLSDQLCEKLSSGVSPRELCSPTVMNAIVSHALQLSVFADASGFEQELAFALKWMPDMLNANDIAALDFLELRYKVEWPVNIVITENSIIKYNKIFSFMLRLKRVSWVLRDIWFHLKHIAFSRDAASSPQLRQLQLYRHEMQHFVQNIEGYLSNQILTVTWVEFQHELANNVRDLDDLHHHHVEYLNKAIFRSLLNKKAAPVMKIINDIFSLVLKFRAQLNSCPWQQATPRGHVTHPSFSLMCSTHKSFQQYSGFLASVVSKLVRRGYQSHLDDFLLRLNFNDFYST